MKNSFFVYLVFCLLVVASCDNKKPQVDESVNVNDAIDTVSHENNLTITDTVIPNKDSMPEEMQKTVYELFGDYSTLYGKVKSMEVISCHAEIIDGYVVIDTANPYSYNTISFFENGEIDKHTYYLRSGGGIWYIEEVDSLGNPLVKAFYGGYSSSFGLTEYLKYDDQNRLVCKSTCDDQTGEILNNVFYFYDTVNNSKIVKSYSGGKINYKTHVVYDDTKSVISSSSYDYAEDTLRSESHTFYSYEYDKYGNWIVLYEDSDPADNSLGATVRRIRYYE